MAFLNWSPNLSVGIEFMDADHKQLITLVNELHDAMHAGGPRDVIATKLNALADFTQEHFHREEEVMEENNYGGFEQHKRLHETLMQEVAELHQDFVSGEMDIGPETTEFLKNWLISHILESDKHLGGFLEGKMAR